MKRIAKIAAEAVDDQGLEVWGKPDVTDDSVYFLYRDYGIAKEREDQCGPDIRRRANAVAVLIRAAVGKTFEVSVSHCGDKNYFDVNIHSAAAI